MKHFILFSAILFCCLVGNAAAQQMQQVDSVPPAQGWAKLTSGTTATLNYLSLVGRDTIYASGNDILRSTDGGITWDSLTNVPSYKGVRMRAAKLQFVDDTIGFLCGSADTVYKTMNGGQTWSANSATGLAGGLVPDFMLFKTQDSGWIYGGNNCRTTDGGASWQVGTSWGNFNCMAFADTKHGYEMGDATPWLPDVRKPNAASFERTTDGGATWILSYAGPSDVGKHTGVTKGIWGIAAISPDTLFAVGEQIARSIDSGNTWDTIAYAGDGYNGFMAVTFPDRWHGAAVGSNGWIFHTNDGGLTWAKQNSGINDGSYLLAVSFIDSLTGFAVGENGTILKTLNGGLSWVRLSLGPTSLLEQRVYPQPASLTSTLAYQLPVSQRVALSLHDITGREVSDVLPGVPQSAGPQSVSIDTSKLASGTYTYVLQTEKYYATGKIEVIH